MRDDSISCVLNSSCVDSTLLRTHRTIPCRVQTEDRHCARPCLLHVLLQTVLSSPHFTDGKTEAQCREATQLIELILEAMGHPHPHLTTHSVPPNPAQILSQLCSLEKRLLLPQAQTLPSEHTSPHPHPARSHPATLHLDVLGVGGLQLFPEVPVGLQHIDDFLEVPVIVQACVLGQQR